MVQGNMSELAKALWMENKVWVFFLTNLKTPGNNGDKPKKWTCLFRSFQWEGKSSTGALKWEKNGWKWNQRLIASPGAKPGLEDKWETVFESEHLYQRPPKMCELVWSSPLLECVFASCVSCPPHPHSNTPVEWGRGFPFMKSQVWAPRRKLRKKKVTLGLSH